MNCDNHKPASFALGLEKKDYTRLVVRRNGMVAMSYTFDPNDKDTILRAREWANGVYEGIQQYSSRSIPTKEGWVEELDRAMTNRPVGFWITTDGCGGVAECGIKLEYDRIPAERKACYNYFITMEFDVLKTILYYDNPQGEEPIPVTIMKNWNDLSESALAHLGFAALLTDIVESVD